MSVAERISGKELQIKQAERDHIDQLAQLDKLCFAQPWSRASFQKEIEENQLALYLVAEIDGETVGYAGLWKVGDEGHITNVAVHPHYRKRGIGKALMAVLVDFTEKQGVNFYTLEVRASNEKAIGLYKQFGFEAAGLRKKYYGDNQEDAIIMNKTEGCQG
ncbi:MAG: ribosomal protein S18-alanine N-acetyltransferase [Anaerovorax sp.]